MDLLNFTCEQCKKPCNNIHGGDCVVKKDKKTKRVCAKCAEKLKKKGWTEISRARKI